MTITPEEKLAMARECAAAYFENDPLDTGRKDLAALIRKGGPADDQDATQICLLAIDRMQERVRAETGWQDIATAPKDGTLIDVWRGGEFPRRVPDVSWREPTDSEWWVHGGDTIRTPAATWHDMFGPFGKDDTPTHWRPLPSPPAIRETPHAEG